MPLFIEFQADDGRWTPSGAPPLEPGDRGGSMADCTADGREVYIFRCEGDHSTIKRSVGGYDYEHGPMRLIGTIDLELVARLDAESPEYEVAITTEKMKANGRPPVPVRFRYIS